jgi:hypothetical protein
MRKDIWRKWGTKQTFSCNAAEAISLHCGRVWKTLLLDLNMCTYAHIQTWEKHFLCPCKNCKRRFVQSNNLKAYISEKQCDFFSLHASLKEQVSTITHTLIYNQFYFSESIQNPSYSNLANIIQNMPELHVSPSSCFTSWNLWSCLANRVWHYPYLMLLHESYLTVNLFGCFSFTTCYLPQVWEFSWRSERNIFIQI